MRLATRYYGVAYGYRKGVDIVKDMGGGFLTKTDWRGRQSSACLSSGALVNKWTHVNIPLVVSTITGQDGQTRVTTVQTILDQLMPGLVPLLLTFACMWLLRKKVNPLWIIVGFFVIGIAGYSVGLLGQLRLLYTTGAKRPRFLFLWRINDYHGPGADSLYCRIIGLRSLRSVHHAPSQWPHSAFYSPAPPRSRRQRYLRWAGRHPYL